MKANCGGGLGGGQQLNDTLCDQILLFNGLDLLYLTHFIQQQQLLMIWRHPCLLVVFMKRLDVVIFPLGKEGGGASANHIRYATHIHRLTRPKALQ